MKSHKSLVLFTLFFVLYIDGLGQGLRFPVLVNVLLDVHSQVLLQHADAATRSFYYGLVIGVFFLTWFIGTAVLGDFSDRVGRKRALGICLGGAILGYVLTAVAFFVHSITLVILGRVIGGLTAGSQAVAQASVVDMSDKSSLTHNMGLVLMAVSIGMIIGPLIGGVFSDQHLFGFFTNVTPLYVAILLSLINLILLWIYFPETREVAGKVKIQWSRIFTIFTAAIQKPGVRYLTPGFLIVHFSWSLYSISRIE